jgi:hypothetical protein
MKHSDVQRGIEPVYHGRLCALALRLRAPPKAPTARRRAGPGVGWGYYQGARPPPSGPVGVWGKGARAAGRGGGGRAYQLPSATTRCAVYKLEALREPVGFKMVVPRQSMTRPQRQQRAPLQYLLSPATTQAIDNLIY